MWTEHTNGVTNTFQQIMVNFIKIGKYQNCIKLFVKQIEITILLFKQYTLLVILLLLTETINKMRHVSYKTKFLL